MTYVVYRKVGRVWLPISRSFPTPALARRYVESLPTDWDIEIREVAE